MTDFRHTTDRLIAGLVGPAEPELTCEQCFELLDVYVELELANEDADEGVPGMEPHLRGCPACAEEHDSLRALIETRGRAS
jgi:hypothetical protein